MAQLLATLSNFSGHDFVLTISETTQSRVASQGFPEQMARLAAGAAENNGHAAVHAAQGWGYEASICSDSCAIVSLSGRDRCAIAFPGHKGSVLSFCVHWVFPAFKRIMPLCHVPEIGNVLPSFPNLIFVIVFPHITVGFLFSRLQPAAVRDRDRDRDRPPPRLSSSHLTQLISFISHTTHL